MAKQILIAQNDFGFIFNFQVFDETKEPIFVGEDNIRFYIKAPSTEEYQINEINIIDAQNGIVEFEIEDVHTQEVGNHEIYVELSSAPYRVTSVLATYYYVMAERGKVGV